jgi:hypothetical protein
MLIWFLAFTLTSAKAFEQTVVSKGYQRKVVRRAALTACYLADSEVLLQVSSFSLTFH